MPCRGVSAVELLGQICRKAWRAGWGNGYCFTEEVTVFVKHLLRQGPEEPAGAEAAAVWTDSNRHEVSLLGDDGRGAGGQRTKEDKRGRHRVRGESFDGTLRI